jgi:hypothetical protein
LQSYAKAVKTALAIEVDRDISGINSTSWYCMIPGTPSIGRKRLNEMFYHSWMEILQWTKDLKSTYMHVIENGMGRGIVTWF